VTWRAGAGQASWIPARIATATSSGTSLIPWAGPVWAAAAAGTSLRHGDVTTAAPEATVASTVLRRPFLPDVDVERAGGRRALVHEILRRCLVSLATARNAPGDRAAAARACEACARTLHVELGVPTPPETSALVAGLR